METETIPTAIEYKMLKLRHPEYDEDLWAKCRAFYAGGKALLGDKRLLESVFPKHMAEESTIYEERKARAYYIPYAGEIIDAIAAALFGEPIKMRSDPESHDSFYDEFIEDCSPPAGRKMPLNDLLRRQLITALLCRQAWTLVDLPERPVGLDAPTSMGEEEQAGLLDAYACPIDPECVIDWEETEDEELLWALIKHKERKRKDIGGDRKMVTERYTHYTATDFRVYEITYHEDKPPQDADMVPLVRSGPHSFGRVPLLRLDVGEGLWAMGKILPIAVAHFNLRNGLNWTELKSLFPILAAFLGPEEAMNPATDDPNRAVNQRFGQGRIATFAANDRLEYVSPDSGPFKAAMEDLAGLRDEMHRVLHHMALSVENSAAALQRSAESKQIDQAATAVILRALGQFVREHAVEIFVMVGVGRVDPESEWYAEGAERFNEQSIEALIEQAGTVETLQIPSATFKRLWSFMIARRLLGENATDEDLEDIRAELEENISNEDFASESMPKASELPPPPQEPTDGEDDGEDDGTNADGEGEPQAG